MRERVDNGRVGEIVGGNVNGLNRCNRTRIGAGDTFLKTRELGGHRGLIAHPRRKLTHQPRNLRASLNEAENVVDEQQDVAMFVVAEILGHRQGDVPNAEPAARCQKP